MCISNKERIRYAFFSGMTLPVGRLRAWHKISRPTAADLTALRSGKVRRGVAGIKRSAPAEMSGVC